MRTTSKLLKKFVKKIGVLLLVCAVCAGILPGEQAFGASKTGTTTLRILSTSDLHGQSVTVNYDSASQHAVGSLAQISTLINNAKSSLKYGNTLLVDAGDTIYGFGSDSTLSGAITGGEYMYAEMAAMGYDALTVGNHDFDYGYTYLQSALDDAGLTDKVIVSNVYDAKTKKNIWAENKVVTKKLNTTTGKTVTAKIGLIGVTVPTLTSHYDHSELLTTKDIVESVEEQVAKLKKKNVDLIIVIGHTGIGAEDEYVQMSENAAYAISEIDGVDAIVGGHAHVNFPSDDANVQKFYNYKGVSSTGLLNGVPYVAVKDHAAALGMVDLKLSVVNGKVKVAGSNVKLKYVKSSTKLDSDIVAINDTYQEQLDEIYSTSLATLNGRVTNYFGTLEDNAAVQLANEAKMHYGLEYINNVATDYSDCQVIAVTEYSLSNSQTTDNYIDIDKNFTVADTLNIQNWNREFAFIYCITGDQLREWIEWQASAYQNPSTASSSDWKDSRVAEYVEEQNLVPVMNADWLDDWEGFLVFDGVEYEIDVSQNARYDKDGNLINKNAHRLTSLTCNGKEVTDGMEFALVCPRMTSSFCKVASSISETIISNKRVYLNTLIQDYLKDHNQYSELNVQADDNWKVTFPEGTNYLVKSSKKSQDIARAEDWYVQTLGTTSKYAYYQMSATTNTVDAGAPLLVLASGNEKVTSHEIPIIVQASDSSGVKTIKYYQGIAPVDSTVWNSAKIVAGNGFKVSENGVYSVMAEDSFGNRTVRYISITNHDSSALEIPEVSKCTNRAKQILGTGEAGAKVYARVGGNTYSATVAEDGSFGISTPYLDADAVVELWAEKNGRKSAQISCVVKRTGANLPTVDAFTNKSHWITGTLNDLKYCKVIAVAGDVVYVPEDGGESAYESSSIYDYLKTIETVKYTVSNGTFKLNVPIQQAGTAVKVYSLDWLDRASVVTNMEAEDVAPNQPTLKQLYTVDDHVYGKVPAAKNAPLEIRVTDGENTYTGTSDENGYFVVTAGGLTAGTELTVTAIDTVNGKRRTSAQAKVTVASSDMIPQTAASDITFDDIDSKDTVISGHMDDYQGVMNLLIGSKLVTINVDEDGYFSYTMSKTKKVGTSIVALVRDTDGTIWDTNRTTVTLALPETPELLTETIFESTKTIKLFCTDRATAVVKIGSKYYKTDQCVYDSKRGGYVYTVTVKKQAEAEQTVIAYMMNATGKSGKVKTVVEADPEPDTDVETEIAAEEE